MADQYPPGLDELNDVGAATVALPQGTVMWRIHNTTSAFVLPWNQLRTWGPVASSRWEPHPLPPADYAPLGSAYVGRDVLTCLAEVFQLTRFVDVDAGAPYVTGFRLARDLVLADLTGEWLLRAGGSAQIIFKEKARTNAWARAIHGALPDLDGLVAPSAVLGGHDVVSLWTAAAFPSAPEMSVPLNSPAIIADIAAAARSIRFGSNVVL
ncbi:RES family NAD+ phosphorylase [Specibacter cremeus]|uniref:RES family NAD+ phosphorylase n=1 Tax=Specibacter cremeus TaxID=1629051 RepID=UPI000F76B005|nr:RES family NAD+ phosphorylase [Specibacter cremeus]